MQYCNPKKADLNFFFIQIEDHLQFFFFIMEDDLKKILNQNARPIFFYQNGRLPHFFLAEWKTTFFIIMEDDPTLFGKME